MQLPHRDTFLNIQGLHPNDRIEQKLCEMCGSRVIDLSDRRARKIELDRLFKLVPHTLSVGLVLDEFTDTKLCREILQVCLWFLLDKDIIIELAIRSHQFFKGQLIINLKQF